MVYLCLASEYSQTLVLLYDLLKKIAAERSDRKYNKTNKRYSSNNYNYKYRFMYNI